MTPGGITANGPPLVVVVEDVGAGEDGGKVASFGERVNMKEDGVIL